LAGKTDGAAGQLARRQLEAGIVGDYRKFRVLGGLEGKKEPYYVTTQSPIDIQ